MSADGLSRGAADEKHEKLDQLKRLDAELERMKLVQEQLGKIDELGKTNREANELSNKLRALKTFEMSSQNTRRELDDILQDLNRNNLTQRELDLIRQKLLKLQNEEFRNEDKVRADSGGFERYLEVLRDQASKTEVEDQEVESHHGLESRFGRSLKVEPPFS